MDGGYQINVGKARPDGRLRRRRSPPVRHRVSRVLFRLLINYMNNVVHVDHTDHRPCSLLTTGAGTKPYCRNRNATFRSIVTGSGNIRFLTCNDRPVVPVHPRDNVDRLQCRPDDDQQEGRSATDIGPHAIDGLSKFQQEGIVTASRRIRRSALSSKSAGYTPAVLAPAMAGRQGPHAGRLPQGRR